MTWKMQNSAPVDHTQQDNRGCVQLKKKTPKLSTRATEKMPSLTKSANEILPSMKFFESQCQYLQMRTLNGFSNLTARADSFTAESEHRDGFPTETLASSPSSSPKLNFSK
jgi:hypothetical protein